MMDDIYFFHFTNH